ncbi:MAG TPA: hypothetical protein DHV54_00690 [Firmicutes bacterium]|jgi:adenylate cyclase class IV|nr:hypothetical protein [Bacillota bacterium]
MEYEVRFYYPSSEVNNLLDKLSELKELEKKPRTYEKTVQYNHSDPRYDFYSKEIDGRFRLRLSKNIEESKCKLSWKRRLPNTTENLVNKEEEKEVRISYEDVDNFIFIIENVMHFKVVDSYERYRTIFTNEDVEISIDEYPFGIALEIENKSSTKNPEEVVMNYVSKLKLNIKDSYRLSWDDKYVELCKEQNKEIYNEVTFDKDMPSI